MARLRLIGRLIGRDLRRRPGQAGLLLLAVTAATSVLALGLVLHGVTSQPLPDGWYEMPGAPSDSKDGEPLVSPSPCV